jgi:hypothetical protein
LEDVGDEYKRSVQTPEDVDLGHTPRSAGAHVVR